MVLPDDSAWPWMSSVVQLPRSRKLIGPIGVAVAVDVAPALPDGELLGAVVAGEHAVATSTDKRVAVMPREITLIFLVGPPSCILLAGK